jgi:oligopeptide/dipeptide ABC transporter ATP-binding protein
MPMETVARPGDNDASERGDSALLEVRDLRVSFPIPRGIFSRQTSRAIRAVDGVTFTISRGETLGLVGESGSGKSTIGRSIAMLQPVSGGSMRLDSIDLGSARGEALRRARRGLGMVFQDPYSSLDPRMTVGSIIAEPLQIHCVGTRNERRERAIEMLGTVGLTPGDANRYPHQFSGGQRQRIAIARALAGSPALVIADEPISALDVSIQAQILNLLESLRQRFGVSYLLIAHNLAAIAHASDRIAVLYLGQLVEVATTTALLIRPMHPYTLALLSAVPIADPPAERRRRRIFLSGDIPSAADPPAGCVFHTRCWLRDRLGRPERCVTERPQLSAVEPGHATACHFADSIKDTAEHREVIEDRAANRRASSGEPTE